MRECHSRMTIMKKPFDPIIKEFELTMEPETLARIDESVQRIVTAKEKGGKVVVVTGSGPNIHEGVTTLIAELMRVGIVDGVTTSSAVVSHEMGGPPCTRWCRGRAC